MSDSPLSWLRKVGGTPPPEPVAPAPAQPPRPVAPPAPAPAPPAAAPLSLVTPEPVTVAPAPGPMATAEGYRAYGSDHAGSPFLDVRRTPEVGFTKASEAFPFAYLLRVSFAGGAMGDRVTLVFSEGAVSLAGIHLEALQRELLAGKVHYVEEYDAARYPTRPAPGVPVILKIELIEPGDAATTGGRRAGKKAAAS